MAKQNPYVTYQFNCTIFKTSYYYPRGASRTSAAPEMEFFVTFCTS